jgi:hypothetical protein
MATPSGKGSPLGRAVTTFAETLPMGCAPGVHVASGELPAVAKGPVLNQD